MGFINSINLALTKNASNSNVVTYNVMRSIKCVFDKFKIKYHYYVENDFIVIYQQGRVASTSIYESLKLLKLSEPVWHVHYISNESNDNLIKEAYLHNKKAYRHLFVGKLLAKLIKHNSKAIKFKIITVLRDPVSVILSTLFINGGRNFSHLLNRQEGFTNADVSACIENMFIKDNIEGWSILKWFEEVMEIEIGVDIFTHEMDRDAGFNIVNDKEFELLLIKFERLNDSYPLAIETFLGVDKKSVTLEHKNLHRNDQFSESQKYAKENLKLPREVCERIYSSRYITHFYNVQEIEHMISKWSK